MPGATRCSSETQLQTCNEQGQFPAATACPFACVNGNCAGECSPGSRRCNPANGTPQFCSGSGVWQSQQPCEFVCTGSGTCGGECAPGSRRCNPASGVPQACGNNGAWQNQTRCDFVCTGNGTCGGECAPGSRRCNAGLPQACGNDGVWQNQARCDFVCTGNGTCGGECTPGSRRCNANTGLPQLCSNGGSWQDQGACPRGCQNGSCVAQLGPGLSCGAGRDCQSGFCESAQSRGLICCTGDCVGEVCRANGQGCVQCDGGPPTCQGNSSRSCVNNTFVSTTCANGCNTNTGQCNNLIPVGSTGCARSNQCAGSGSASVGNRCCEFDCAAAGRQCDGSGLCRCPDGTMPSGGACLFVNGHTCNPDRDDECASGRCISWFRDADGDTHGDPNQVLNVCGNVGSPPPAGGYVSSSDDCCDSDRNTNPDAALTSFDVALAQRNACGSFDRNCDGTVTNFGQFAIGRGFTLCSQIPIAECVNVVIWTGDPNDPVADANNIPTCGTVGLFNVCHNRLVQSGTPSDCHSIAGGTQLNQCM